jgi:site-specific recombinase XerD
MSRTHIIHRPSATLSRSDLDGAAEAAKSYVSRSRAERTQSAYRQQWRVFLEWCASSGLEPLPAAPETVSLYLATRAQEGRKVSTLEQALTAISQAHQLAGHESPRAAKLVRDTLRGIRREHGAAPAQKAPLYGQQLRVLLSSLQDTVAGHRDRALLLLGFAGAFRRSELVALERKDLAFGADGLTVAIRRSKTDQEGRGRKVGIPYGSEPLTCPVRALQRWLSHVPGKDGVVFRSVSRHGKVGKALDGRDVARIIKRACARAQVDASMFSGHSLRAGLATAAAKAGKATHAIMKQTGHKSVAMVQRYIRDATLFDENAFDGLL